MARRSSVKGAAKLRRTLRKVDVEISSELTAELAKAGALIAEDARANAPVRSGFLKKSIRFQLAKDGLSVRIGSFGGRTQRAHHAALVEFGTARGNRIAKDGSVYLHPGSAPHPWLMPAYQSHKRDVFRRIREKTIATLDKASRGHGSADE